VQSQPCIYKLLGTLLLHTGFKGGFYLKFVSFDIRASYQVELYKIRHNLLSIGPKELWLYDQVTIKATYRLYSYEMKIAMNNMLKSHTVYFIILTMPCVCFWVDTC
jgi:hypothetical protein